MFFIPPRSGGIGPEGAITPVDIQKHDGIEVNLFDRIDQMIYLGIVHRQSLLSDVNGCT